MEDADSNNGETPRYTASCVGYGIVCACWNSVGLCLFAFLGHFKKERSLKNLRTRFRMVLHREVLFWKIPCF